MHYSLNATPELLNTVQHLFVLEDPTFGAMMEFFSTIGESLGNSLYMGAALWVHGIAKANQAQVPYTTTVEALWTALNQAALSTGSADWRMWALLDRLDVTEVMLHRVVADAVDAVHHTKTPHAVYMLTPCHADYYRKTYPDRKIVFCTTAKETRELYSVEELSGSLYPKFAGSVVGSWQGISAPKRTWFGARTRMTKLPVRR